MNLNTILKWTKASEQQLAELWVRLRVTEELQAEGIYTEGCAGWAV